MKKIKAQIFLLFIILYSTSTYSQTDSLRILKADSIIPVKVDSSKIHNPRIATLRSAMIPGWGQAYNKRYWKIPIIYGALGTTVGIFFFNLKTYKQLKQAYIYRTDSDPANDALIAPDFAPLSDESIRTYRNSFRQNIDYTVLAFLVLWGINVVDATVDAHLRAFDVSDQISMRIKPGLSPITSSAGLTFVFSFNHKKQK